MKYPDLPQLPSVVPLQAFAGTYCHGAYGVAIISESKPCRFGLKFQGQSQRFSADVALRFHKMDSDGSGSAKTSKFALSRPEERQTARTLLGGVNETGV